MTENISFGRVAAMLPVPDMQQALEFYVEFLGFEVIFQNGDPVGFVIIKKGAAEIHLTLQPQHKATHFNVAHLLVNNTDALYDKLTTHNIRIIKELQDKEYGLRAFVFEDPFGNRIDVGQVL